MKNWGQLLECEGKREHHAVQSIEATSKGRFIACHPKSAFYLNTESFQLFPSAPSVSSMSQTTAYYCEPSLGFFSAIVGSSDLNGKIPCTHFIIHSNFLSDTNSEIPGMRPHIPKWVLIFFSGGSPFIDRGLGNSDHWQGNTLNTLEASLISSGGSGSVNPSSRKGRVSRVLCIQDIDPCAWVWLKWNVLSGQGVVP